MAIVESLTALRQRMDGLRRQYPTLRVVLLRQFDAERTALGFRKHWGRPIGDWESVVDAEAAAGPGLPDWKDVWHWWLYFERGTGVSGVGPLTAGAHAEFTERCLGDVESAFGEAARLVRDEALRNAPALSTFLPGLNAPPRWMHWLDALFCVGWRKDSGVAVHASNGPPESFYKACRQVCPAQYHGGEESDDDEAYRLLPELCECDLAECRDAWESEFDSPVLAASVALLDYLIAHAANRSNASGDFLTAHRQRTEAESAAWGERIAESRRHQAEFVEPWNANWKLLAAAVATLHGAPDDAPAQRQFAEAVQALAALARDTIDAGRIRLAASHRRQQAERDPTGRSIELHDVADRAAILTVLEAALDDPAAVDELARQLRIGSSPFVGERCQSEVDWAEGLFGGDDRGAAADAGVQPQGFNELVQRLADALEHEAGKGPLHGRMVEDNAGDWTRATFKEYPQGERWPGTAEALTACRDSMVRCPASLADRVAAALARAEGFATTRDDQTVAAALPTIRQLAVELRTLAAEAKNAPAVKTASDASVNGTAPIPERDSIEQLEQKTPTLARRNKLAGDAGETETPVPPINGDSDDGGANRYAHLESLQPAHRNAYLSYLYAEAVRETRLEDRDAWNWLNEYGVQGAWQSTLQDYDLPAFATWSRYLRVARKSLDERKYTPRSGRQQSG